MDNPYSTSGVNPASHSTNDSISPGVIAALAGTKPWVRFCSVLGFIGTGFMLLAAIGMILFGALAPMSASNGSGSAGMGVFSSGLGIGMGLAYLVIGALYFIPSLKLWKYGSFIGNLLSTNSTTDLEAALDAQRSFWKFVSIMIIVGFVLYIGVIILAVIFGLFAASGATT